MKWLFTLATTVLFLYAPLAQAGGTLVTPAKAQKLIDSGAIDLILDVRTQDEYTGPLGRLKNAQLLPVQRLEEKLPVLLPFREKSVLIYCHSGGRSSKAARILLKNGFKSVLDLEGGIVGWRAAGLPVVKQ